MPPNKNPHSLRLWVGLVAIAAPALHSTTDVMEWWSGGFTEVQLWMNLAAFLPMPFLLLGICALLNPRPNYLCFLGALLYGLSFAYFAYSTIYAIERNIPNYPTLWNQLGAPYTLAGAFMVVGGCLFAIEALRSSPLPKTAVWLFLLGVVVNLGLAILPAPDILQTIGSAIRNAGLLLMGYYIVNEKEGAGGIPRGAAERRR